MNSRFLTVREIIKLSVEFLQGLNNIYIKRLIHFDIKPDNILISDSGEALVSDFGLAKAMNHVGMASPDKFYTGHMPPEYFDQSQHTTLYDIYASGLTIYRMCNGNKNFDEQFELIQSDDEHEKLAKKAKFPDRKGFLPHIPKELRTAVNNALKVDQDKRTTNALVLINELNKINSLLDWQYTEQGSEKYWQLTD